MFFEKIFIYKWICHTSTLLPSFQKHLILKKMIVMSKINPRIESLKGVPLEALQRLIRFSKDNDIIIEKYENAFNIVLDYLSSVEKKVNQIIEERREIRKRLLINGVKGVFDKKTKREKQEK